MTHNQRRRNFPNFLDAYVQYATDDFCPQQFHLWAGLSVLSGALERKVWTSQALVTHYPNVYALLVSHPGMGKSTALERGVNLLEKLKERYNHEFKIIPNQITEPALIDMMNIQSIVMLNGTTGVPQSAGYFYASEASSSALQNIHGDFNAALCAFYDCPKMFRKKIKMENRTVEIPNSCMNVLAGSTFDFLKRLVNEDSVMGGLASRFIYVICKDRIVRQSRWDTAVQVDKRTRDLLVEDLHLINQLTGPFRPTPGFIARWEKFQPEFDQYLIDLNSPRMESLMARKATNLMKICMLLSVAEGDTLELNEGHWEKASEIIEEVTKDNAFVISSALIGNIDTQSGLNQFIMQTLKRKGGSAHLHTLRAEITRQGNDISRVELTLKHLVDCKFVNLITDGNSSRVDLLVDPDRYL